MDASLFDTLREHLAQHLIGQTHLVDSMLICLLSDGHMLVEGMPGLAKTTAIKSLAEAIECDFHRIQFTPDLLPADLVGTDIYQHERSEFIFSPGPLFHNVLLADEINRAPPKVQSALLEAMAERQITVGQCTYPLPSLFMVLATQNPVEHEGTYTLPEAQLDRFLLQVLVDYPSRDEELEILNLIERQKTGAVVAMTPELAATDATETVSDATTEDGLTPVSIADPAVAATAVPNAQQPAAKLTQADLFAARQTALKTYIDPKLKEYIVDLIRASREPKAYDADLERWHRFGASPRASIALIHCAKALAWLQGERYVTPEHIQAMVPDVLRHRVLLSFEAEADGIAADQFIDRLLQVVAVP